MTIEKRKEVSAEQRVLPPLAAVWHAAAAQGLSSQP